MANTQVIFGTDARDKILEGARKGAEAIIPTLGPAGRNVAIRKSPIELNGQMYYTAPMITKDGVTALNAIASFECPWEDIGLQMLKQAAQNTNKTGDGTTTSALLAYEMMKGGKQLLDAGANAIHVRRGMEKACEAICTYLKDSAKKVEGIDELRSIARISSQDDELADVVSNAVMEVGKAGAVTMQAGGSTKTEYNITHGMHVKTGFASHYFANMKNGTAQIKDVFVLVTMERIASIRDIAGILQKLRNQLDANPDTKDEAIQLAIFSTGISGDAMTTLAKNNREHPDQLQCVVLNPPYFGARTKDVLEDIAIATGAKLIDKTAGTKLQDMTIVDLGTCDSVIASEEATTIVGANGNKATVQDRIGIAKAKIDTLDEKDDAGEIDYLKSRIAGLDGKFANIYVGGSSQLEQREKMHRVEDAIAASKAAYEGGIVAGGGVALLRSAKALESLSGNEGELAGIGIVKSILGKQLSHVVINAGENAQEIIDTVLVSAHNEGFNAETREYGDMLEMKVVDPARVPIAALKNSVSVAGAFLTIETAVSNN